MSRRMAVIRNPSSPASNTELPLVFNNGDFTALKDAVERLGFKDEESLLRFALAVFAKSATRSFTVVDQNNKPVSLTPSPSLLKETAAHPTNPPAAA